MQAWIESYLVAQKRAVDSLQPAQLVQLVETLKTAHGADRQIFVVGNGGSAANASHFAVDLGKGASDKLGRRFRVLSLCDNTPWLTALGNDYSYDEAGRYAPPAMQGPITAAICGTFSFRRISEL